MPRRLIVLRPEPGNAATCSRIRAAGGVAVALPLFEIQPLDWTPPDPAGFDSLLLTSANAPRHAGAALAAYAHLPVVAVGNATARAAEAAGLRVVAIGGSDGEAAVALLARHGLSRALLLSGREHILEAGGPIAAVVPVYAGEPLEVDPGPIAGATALIHSPRAGWRLGELVDAHGLDRATISVAAISANALAAAGPGWGAATVAPDVSDAALVAAALSIDPTESQGDKAPMIGDEVSFEAQPKRRARGSFWALVVLGAFLIGIVVAAWWLMPAWQRWRTAATPQPQPVVAARPAATAPIAVEPGADLTSLYAREITLAARLEALEQRLSGIEGDSRVASGYATRAEGVLVAFAARRALDRGLPLGYVEGQLRERFGAYRPNAVNAVIDAAAHPVTLEDLRMGLDPIAPTLMSSARDGWLPALRREVAGLVVLRADTTPSARPADRLTRARRLIDAGHVEAAMAEISRMPGAANAQGWVNAARRYVTARRALNVIEATALALPEPPRQPAPEPTEAIETAR